MYVLIDWLIYSDLTSICSRCDYDRHRYFTLKSLWLSESRCSVLKHRVSEVSFETLKILIVDVRILAIRRSFKLSNIVLMIHCVWTFLWFLEWDSVDWVDLW